MTAPEITYPPPADDTPPKPYERAVPVTLTEGQTLNLTQLTDELSKATGHQVEVALAEVDGERTLAVVPGNLNPKVVQQVVADHSPEDGYEVPEEEKAYLAVRDKVSAGATKLDDAELQTAVIGLLRQAISTPARRR